VVPSLARHRTSDTEYSSTLSAVRAFLDDSLAVMSGEALAKSTIGGHGMLDVGRCGSAAWSMKS
jgi:hypothetical protein